MQVDAGDISYDIDHIIPSTLKFNANEFENSQSPLNEVHDLRPTL